MTSAFLEFEWTLYEITGGPIMEAERAVQAQAKVFHKLANKLKTEHGATDVWAGHKGIAALKFEKEPDEEVWKPGGKYKFYSPRKKHPKGKEILEVFDSKEAEYPDIWWFCEKIGFNRLSLFNSSKSIAFVKEFDRWILGLPGGSQKWTPPAEFAQPISQARYLAWCAEAARMADSMPTEKLVRGSKLTISIDQRSWAVFVNGVHLIKDFVPYCDERVAKALALQWCAAAGDKKPEIVYPKVTRLSKR